MTDTTDPQQQWSSDPSAETTPIRRLALSRPAHHAGQPGRQDHRHRLTFAPDLREEVRRGLYGLHSQILARRVRYRTYVTDPSCSGPCDLILWLRGDANNDGSVPDDLTEVITVLRREQRPAVVFVPDVALARSTERHGAASNAKFFSHVAREFLGSVEERFDIATDRAHRSIIGSGSAALTGLELAAHLPSLFARCAAHNPQQDEPVQFLDRLAFSRNDLILATSFPLQSGRFIDHLANRLRGAGLSVTTTVGSSAEVDLALARFLVDIAHATELTGADSRIRNPTALTPMRGAR